MTKDQKTALGIGGAGLGGFLLWRRSHKSTSTRTTGHGAPPLTNAAVGGSIAPYTPQDPITISPGDSIYDPNSEALLNTPTSPLIDNGGFTYGPSGEQQLGQVVAPSAPNYVVKVQYPKRVTTHRNRRQPVKRRHHKRRHRRAAVHG